MSTILLIDDEEKLRHLFARIIGLEGYHVIQAEDYKTGLQLMQKHAEIDIILTDVKLPDGNGIDLVPEAKKYLPAAEIIVMTAFATIHDGIEAMKRGAFDYFVKGDDNDKIIPALSRAVDKVQLQKQVYSLQAKLNDHYSFEQIIGNSPAIQNVIKLAKKVAGTDTTVLITGETGVGKELFAQSIHYSSNRKNKNFVAINCSAFPKELLESELFGHKKGAFTGADKDKKGLFEEAHLGTLFLDEIGEMPVELQAKLLRVLETQTFTKLGETKPLTVDVRIVAATNRDLQKEIDAQGFRADLFYRLATFVINIPSLNERVEDIEALTSFFIQRFAAKTKKIIKGIQKDALLLLKNYRWKGNIRELRNVIERACILCDTHQITIDDLPFEMTHPHTQSASPLSLNDVEKLHIQKVLAITKGNKTKTAELLNIGLTTLYRKMEEYGISHP
ncbi:sigma-54-dependent transcriptional regulator [Pinibacter aurantiacus]|uniref:Sigma-54 dependent transcriptional regulator n=1 Tax=Pinibacter aurantiacus TaxID=2851599 RepID=A0A9E2SBS6_9BACT|nr:sigma-54 dependent transcriptional regulator [Pinibacter aurantiacus]MBV4360111.1 sigma-54 dependent transcriptional regulator [Pinibacter aurantiacus]